MAGRRRVGRRRGGRRSAVGDRVDRVPRRTRATVRWAAVAPEGGLTPLLLVPDAASGRRLFPVPDGMPLTTAALAEPLAVGMQAVNQSEARAG